MVIGISQIVKDTALALYSLLLVCLLLYDLPAFISALRIHAGKTLGLYLLQYVFYAGVLVLAFVVCYQYWLSS